MTIELRAEWSAAYVNDLPDSSFLLILPGGHKDAESKTMPRDLRKFPVKDAAGKVDEPHLANALARIPQAATISAAQRMAAMEAAKALAKGTNVSGPKGEYSGTAGSGRSLPPAELLVRSFDVALEVRDSGDGRTLIGRAVPYGETINLPGTDGQERFMPGAFARQIALGPDHLQRIKLFDSHQARLGGQSPIGKTAMLEERQDGLHGAWPLYNTTKANDALELVRSGEVTGLSIGFKLNGRPSVGADGAYERSAAHLDHIVLTHEPAYPSAAVTAIRSVHPIGGYRRTQAHQHRILDRLGVGR